MVSTYSIWLKKNNTRVSAGRLTGADTRIFHLELKKLLGAYESLHREKLNQASLLIVVDGKEHYRTRYRLRVMKILTVEDVVRESTIGEPISHILIDGVCTPNLSQDLDTISVLELFSPSMYQSDELEKYYTKR